MVKILVSIQNGLLAEAITEIKELADSLNIEVSTLKEREQTVIKMRFGLENFAKTTLEDIGKIFEILKNTLLQKLRR